MDTRENYLAFLHHEPVEWIPNFFEDVCHCGGAAESFENGPAGGGEDGFGVRWLPTCSASGQVVPAPGRPVLRDITTWEDVVHFPDLDTFDWETLARAQLRGNEDRHRVVEYHSWNSQFLRLTHLMTFEEALCALYEEPEACDALLSAITDYKIRLLERVHDFFHPDCFVNYDDVATERGLFLSPDSYRRHIKPQHRRMNEAVIALGMIPEQHCCGRCEDIIADFLDEGSAVWQSAQPSNDIGAILARYGDRLSVVGSYDTQGPAAGPNATAGQIVAEVDRCYAEYGRYGHSYCFSGLLLANSDDSEAREKLGLLVQRASANSKQGKK